jgi:putative transposase
MRKSRFAEAQRMGDLHQIESGLSLADVFVERTNSSATFYKWRSKYGGMDESIISDLSALEDENRCQYGFLILV